MSSRRHLVNRSNRPSAASETPAHRQDARRPAAVLPSYQPLECPLTANAKRDLEVLGTNINDRNYTQHSKDAVKYLSSAVEETSEMLDDQRKKLQQLVQKRERNDGEKTEFEEKVEQNIKLIEGKLKEYIVEGEKAVREVIDYEFLYKENANILRSIHENIAAAPAPAARERTHRRRNLRNSGEDDEDDENEDDEESDSEDQAPALKPSELLKQKQNESRALYEAKSPRDRYAESNEYIDFKATSHFAKHGEDVPVPHKRNWFREDGDESPEPEQSNNGDESDDDLVLQSATVNTKCPLSMMDLTEPYSNKNCIHVYEKKSLLEYIQSTGTSYTRGRGQPGPKQVKCVVPGCDAMIGAGDCFTDHIVARKVKKALAEAKRLEEEDSEEDEDAMPGTQRNRPAEIDEDDEENDREQQRRRITRVKAERVSRGVSSVPTQLADASGVDDEEQMGEDEDEMDEDTGLVDDYEV